MRDLVNCIRARYIGLVLPLIRASRYGMFILGSLLAMAPVTLNAQQNSESRLPRPDEAPIALLVDLTSGQTLYARNADTRFIPASITKVMTLFLAFELLEEGKLHPDQRFTVRPETFRAWSGKGSTMFLPADANVSVAELLFAIANISANDGSVALAEGHAGSISAWADEMNAKARSIGMADSRFGTPNGWPDEGKTFTSANDLAILALTMLQRHPAKFEHYIGRATYTYNGITQPNHDPMLGKVRGADGIKTGFTNEAGYGFLGTASRNGQRLAMVIAGVERSGLRARLAREFIEWGFENFDRERLFLANQVIANAKVQGGTTLEVPLVSDRNVYVNLPQGIGGDVTMRVRYIGPLRAPLAAGDRVAELLIEVPGMQTATIPLRAGRDVETAGFVRRIVNGFAGWIR